MKTVLVTLVALILLVLGALLYMAQQSKIVPSLVGDGVLHACENTSNCVSSLPLEGSQAIEPIPVFADVEGAWLRLQRVTQQRGGQIERRADNYMWVTYRSALFGFVDDVEFLVDRRQRLIHVRSASRRGQSDFGVNRKRLDIIREDYIASTKR